MRWRHGRQSSHVEDRRGQRLSGGAKIGGGAGLILLLVVMLLGGDPGQVLQLLGGGGSAVAPAAESSGPPEDEAGRFMSAVLAMTEDVWTDIFSAAGARYTPPTLVLFTSQVRSACGFASAATGPFYCPADQKLYLDTSFFDELARMGGPGDFAQAYVIGHEVGHHIQNLTGTLDQSRQMQARASSEAAANQIQVRVELQADCYAGVWASNAVATGFVTEITEEDVRVGLDAAAAVGDDRIQEATAGRADPETFSHGTSAQRQEWFLEGYRSGDPDRCDTFSGPI